MVNIMATILLIFIKPTLGVDTGNSSYCPSACCVAVNAEDFTCEYVFAISVDEANP